MGRLFGSPGRLGWTGAMLALAALVPLDCQQAVPEKTSPRQEETRLATEMGRPTFWIAPSLVFLTQRLGDAESQSRRTTLSALCLGASEPLCQETNHVALAAGCSRCQPIELRPNDYFGIYPRSWRLEIARKKTR